MNKLWKANEFKVEMLNFEGSNEVMLAINKCSTEYVEALVDELHEIPDGFKLGLTDSLFVRMGDSYCCYEMLEVEWD